MLIEEQEDVIAMLERLRAKKRYVRWNLFSFSFSFLFAGEEKETKIVITRADFLIILCPWVVPQITVARVFGKGDRYQGRGI
jgi:hypothetical protein